MDISAVNVSNFDDKYFSKDAKKKKSKGEGEFFESDKEVEFSFFIFCLCLVVLLCLLWADICFLLLNAGEKSFTSGEER